ncbi:MAG: AAA family ATPase [Candidatus Accumulibacter sp.]|jgi:superfamily II DNA or RNA helicase|uniref:AAA family ATPase n=1 Tax=Accumulibacter sp. TaxID=2053492 RepID=UPI002587BA3D|nr:AAA family ATPase [Accumulibacter sp.]MBK8117256.1 AAA family ATPase [Accumulibacter sp.]
MKELSAEQQDIIDMSLSSSNLWIQAYAGTGKTTTLREIAATLEKQGRSCLYIAFNSHL